MSGDELTDDEVCEEIPAEIKELADAASIDILTKKTKDKYLKAYNDFKNWKKQKKCNLLKEDTFLAYFAELAKVKKPPKL